MGQDDRSPSHSDDCDQFLAILFYAPIADEIVHAQLPEGVAKGFPLKIEAEKWEIRETEYNPELIENLLPRIEWEALRQASETLGLDPVPADEEVEGRKDDEAFLRLVHKLLLDTHIDEGALICPETGRRFPIKEGIPNMLLHEDEV